MPIQKRRPGARTAELDKRRGGRQAAPPLSPEIVAEARVWAQDRIEGWKLDAQNRATRDEKAQLLGVMRGAFEKYIATHSRFIKGLENTERGRENSYLKHARELESLVLGLEHELAVLEALASDVEPHPVRADENLEETTWRVLLERYGASASQIAQLVDDDPSVRRRMNRWIIEAAKELRAARIDLVARMKRTDADLMTRIRSRKGPGSNEDLLAYIDGVLARLSK